MTRDLLLSHPSFENVSIIPTFRDPNDGLALSSRNAYLSADEREVAGCLYAALRIAAATWRSSRSAGAGRAVARQAALSTAQEHINANKTRCEQEEKGVAVKVDYIEINDPESFEVVEDDAHSEGEERDVIISGAVWIGRTRLIDNLIVPVGEPEEIRRIVDV